MDSRSNNYDDIIDIEYLFELKYARMNKTDRAAQFSAFQALSGYEAGIREAARPTLTDKRVELDEFSKDVLNTKLNRIKENIRMAISSNRILCAGCKKRWWKICNYH